MLFLTLFKETVVLREYTDIASTVSLVVSVLEYTRRPNKLFLQYIIHVNTYLEHKCIKIDIVIIYHLIKHVNTFLRQKKALYCVHACTF